MRKSKVITNFVCQECGYDTTSWLGKCPECGVWNSLKEIKVTRDRGQAIASNAASQVNVMPQSLKDIVYEESSRIKTKYDELDTVLGGGIVRGSVSLIAGDPGVGKSTLLLQLALDLSVDQKILYVSGEESAQQVKMRAERISKHKTENLPAGKQDIKLKTNTENLFLLSLTNSDAIIDQIDDMKPDLVIVDSIQTLESENTSGLAGSVSQIRYSALQLVRIAKQNSISIMIVGHVTKDGMVAGPMILSHMVDTVLFLEGEKNESTRILRVFKNRFGPVDEVGIFVMNETGMVEVQNPSELFLDENKATGPGSVRVVTLEGSRAFVIEIQALAVSTRLSLPRRVVSGIDQRRVELLLAVLQKHAKFPVDSMDIFVNIAGGLRITDRAVDLGVCLAIYSSLRNTILSKIVGIAEVGLLGELRAVPNLEKRVKEAKKLGFKDIITHKTHKTLSEVIEFLNKSEIRISKSETMIRK